MANRASEKTRSKKEMKNTLACSFMPVIQWLNGSEFQDKI